MVSSNQLRSAWREGRETYGVWCSVPNSFSAELVAVAGCDYVCVDLQHGMVDFSSVVPMMQGIISAGAAPVVRVPRNDPQSIGKALDAGASGVIVPLVESVEAAKAAAAAFRYPPDGGRSYGPTRASIVAATPTPEDFEDVACIVMVETQAGLAHVGEIAAVTGIDAIYIGPADLAVTLGVRGALQERDDVHEEAITRIRETCAARGVIAGIHCKEGEGARARREQGFQMITVGHDALLLRLGAIRELAAARRH